ncbi:MAG: cyclic nucleotide-binding domain-containing protein [Rhodospirillaceae bacterium]|nr:cyclic nucleotide-binding domain-containing protein [Rhodospirillaceae bacterium]
MERGLFRFIWRYSAKDQFILVGLSVAAMPFLYWTFELPKIIVNQAISGEGGFPKIILGYELAQIPYLYVLCAAFLALVLINGAQKYFSSTYRYRVGDRLLRRLRYTLIERLLRFPVSDLRSMSSGQVVSMVTAETSTLGFFMAEAFAVPAVAAGTLGTIILFMFMQNWTMGVAAIALYPLQIYIIPRIQKRINWLQREEALAVRGISNSIGELVSAAPEIHGHDTTQYELASLTERLGRVFTLRVEMGSKRYTVNVLNQFFSQLTPFFFFSIGGYLVIKGDISLGSLVAVLAAYKDMYSPWKDLIDYYQKAEDGRVKYDQLAEYFGPPGLMDSAIIAADPAPGTELGTQLIASNVVVEAEEGVKSIDGATVALQLPVHAAIIGGSGSGREEFARLLARQVMPAAGKVSLGEHDLTQLPDSVTGRRIGYVSTDTYLGSGAIRGVLIYPLLRRPNADVQYDDHTRRKRANEMKEAARTGNSTYDILADWIDYAAAGCAAKDDLRQRIVDVLRMVELEREIYDIGLRRTLDPGQNPELAQKFITARHTFRERLQSRQLTGLIETLDRDAYISNASVAENILFGTPIGAYFAIDRLGENEYLLGIIERAGLTQEFLEKGRKLAGIMTDIFRDLPPGHEFFDRFSFIRYEDLPVIEGVLRKAEFGLDALMPEDRSKLMDLPFKLVEAQHHVGLVDDDFKQRILDARAAFARDLPDTLKGAVQFFDTNSYNAATSVAENVLFGKLAAAKAGRLSQVTTLITDIIDEMGLRNDVVELGLDYDIGIGGGKLSATQRQKLALARCVLKRPDLLILNDALSALEPAAQENVFINIRAEMKGRSLVLLESGESRAVTLDRVLVMENGKIAEKGGTAPVATASSEQQIKDIKGDGRVDLYDMVAVLSQIPLFSGIDRSKLKLLAFTSERVNYDENQIVFRQGDIGDKAYVVLDGIANVILESDIGSTVVAQIKRHQVFGEMALLSAMPRTTTIRAKTALSLLAINHDVFVRLVEENSDIAVSITRLLAERLASTLRDYSRVASQK